jgi:hypothetical protein
MASKPPSQQKFDHQQVEYIENEESEDDEAYSRDKSSSLLHQTDRSSLPPTTLRSGKSKNKTIRNKRSSTLKQRKVTIVSELRDKKESISRQGTSKLVELSSLYNIEDNKRNQMSSEARKRKGSPEFKNGNKKLAQV